MQVLVVIGTQKTIVFKSEIPQRLDVFLTEFFPEKTRSQFQRLIKEEFVTINQQLPRKTGQLLEQGDNISVFFPPPEDLGLQAEDIQLEIIYEDDNTIIVNKPAGMVVHPSAGHHSSTLVHALLFHNSYLEGIGGKRRPGIVHRLDKDTSGVIIVAKNEMSHIWLQRQFKQRYVEKHYLALVDGLPSSDSGRIVASIYRDKKQRKKMAIAPEGQGKPAETHYKVVQFFTQHTLLDVMPLTGRTHQIRVHLSGIGLPICGDRIYGRKKTSLEITRQFLHAASISIRLPGEKTQKTFSAELPIDLQKILEKLE